MCTTGHWIPASSSTDQEDSKGRCYPTLRAGGAEVSQAGLEESVEHVPYHLTLEKGENFESLTYFQSTPSMQRNSWYKFTELTKRMCKFSTLQERQPIRDGIHREAVECGGADLDLGDRPVVVRLDDVFEVGPQLRPVHT